ncbi:XRE family transcriptional regulator [Anaerotruncus sp. 80]|uniref:XRE family transcriptional regulator n=1 Tax=Anaerotruncus colihominis TaxID=169435 RepID=A0A845QMG3_9FIRM|nr:MULTISPECIES: helix-turn-helix transcriptional regulator [Anaerotruncus]NBH62816.1 XRE family transcriptional regulator [Anaerotruncus colihominis]NCF03470.1 XRE family transcriptional regulator [Anaerotruncus sp. 80]
MAIGERIHFFRIMRGMTQKYLGMLVGFPERSADVRLAQYETGSRKPKADLTAALAQALDVAPQALDIPDIDSYIGLMHTLFALEDIYGLTVSETGGEACLKINKDKSKDAAELLQMLCAWKEQTDKLSFEEISREEYDQWWYNYPKFDTMQHWAKVPSKELSDSLVEVFRDKLKTD